MNSACMKGDLETVKTLGLPEDNWAIYYASGSGNLELVKYLISINAPLGSNATPCAALCGHFDIVKYLISINAPIDVRSISYVYVCGNMDISKYLLWNGVPYDDCNIREIYRELFLEFEQIVSEFIGPDISGLIFDYLLETFT